MPLPPLTHHEIVRLVEPFARQGRLVDLAACDRTARRIVFRPRQLPGPTTAALQSAPGDMPSCHETLTLDCPADNYFELRRTLTPADGPATCAPATVSASGPEPAALLARVDAVPVSQLFSAGPGWRVARSYDTELPSGVRQPCTATAQPPLVLGRAELQSGGLTLELIIKLPGLRSVPADLTLRPLPGPAHNSTELPELPEDLLAVLGWDWARLVRDKHGWTSKLRLRGPVLRRSRTAEQALDRVGAHLAHVLSGPPGRFHDEHRLARWGVVLRRGLPTLTAVFMVWVRCCCRASATLAKRACGWPCTMCR